MMYLPHVYNMENIRGGARMVKMAYRHQSQIQRDGGELEPWARELINNERSIRYYLRHKTPEQWLADIELLPDFMQVRIAHIIWWDFFGGRKISQRWPHLDHYLDQPIMHWLTRDEIAAALHFCGYSQFSSVVRCGSGGNGGPK